MTDYFDPGGLQKLLLLGSDTVGAEALIRFYLFHVMLLPVALTALMAVHFWRIRKDGGISRPGEADKRLGKAEGMYPAFTEMPAKTYHLAAIVRGKTPAYRR